jgi:hypothetical protein
MCTPTGTPVVTTSLRHRATTYRHPGTTRCRRHLPGAPARHPGLGQAGVEALRPSGAMTVARTGETRAEAAQAGGHAAATVGEGDGTGGEAAARPPVWRTHETAGQWFHLLPPRRFYKSRKGCSPSHARLKCAVMTASGMAATSGQCQWGVLSLSTSRALTPSLNSG